MKFSIFTQKDTKIRQFLSQKGFTVWTHQSKFPTAHLAITDHHRNKESFIYCSIPYLFQSLFFYETYLFFPLWCTDEEKMWGKSPKTIVIRYFWNKVFPFALFRIYCWYWQAQSFANDIEKQQFCFCSTYLAWF